MFLHGEPFLRSKIGKECLGKGDVSSKCRREVREIILKKGQNESGE